MQRSEQPHAALDAADDRKDERLAHRRRVAELCRRVARQLELDGPVGLALVLAATQHGDGVSLDRWFGSAESEAAASTGEATFESVVAGMAEAILRHRQRAPDEKLSPELQTAVHILNACDEFDEAVECAPLEQKSFDAALTAFFEDPENRLECRLRDALRQMTPATQVPLDPHQLPVLPAAAIKLMRTSDSVSAVELEEIVSPDPVLTARLVGAANSARFGGRSEIRGVSQAIMRVGVPVARKLLLAACFGRVFASSTLAALWSHSRMVAAHAYELAAECGYDRDLAYVAGMVHDIGRLVTQRWPVAMRIEEDNLRRAGFPLAYAESLVGGIDHAALGARILQLWNVPPEIVKAVELHHSPENGDSVLAAILNLAEDDSLAAGSPSEALWRGMRRAASGQLTGIHGVSRHHAKRKSMIWSLAS